MKCFRCGVDYTINKSKFPCGDCRKNERRRRKDLGDSQTEAWLEALTWMAAIGRIGQAIAEGEALRTMLQRMRSGVGMHAYDPANKGELTIARLVRAPESNGARRELGGGKTRIWFLFDITGQVAMPMLTDEQAYALAATEDVILRWPRGKRWATGEMLQPKKKPEGGELTPLRPRRPRGPRPSSPPGVDTAA